MGWLSMIFDSFWKLCKKTGRWVHLEKFRNPSDRTNDNKSLSSTNEPMYRPPIFKDNLKPGTRKASPLAECSQRRPYVEKTVLVFQIIWDMPSFHPAALPGKLSTQIAPVFDIRQKQTYSMGYPPHPWMLCWCQHFLDSFNVWPTRHKSN